MRAIEDKKTIIAQLLVLLIIGCSQIDALQRKSDDASSKPNPSPSNSSPISSVSPTTTPVSVPTARNRPQRYNPVIIIPGWGHDYLDHEPMRQWLRDEGYDDDDVVIIPYPYLAEVEIASTDIQKEMNAFLALYPIETKFDVVGISTGHFIGLHAIMSAAIDQRIDRYIGVAGIAHGVSNFSNFAIAGRLIETISPANNTFIQSFYGGALKDRIDGLKKCSLFSPQDQFIEPWDSGRFANGVNVEVPNAPHLEMMSARTYFDALKASCYAGSFMKDIVPQVDHTPAAGGE